MILQTSILPIEFDYKTIIKVQQTKRLLDSNPQFFKAFLPSANKISFTDKDSNIYIDYNDSVLKHLKNISESEAILMLEGKSSITEKDKILILMYLWNERIGGDYDYSTIDSCLVEEAATKIYYFERKDYEGYYLYLQRNNTHKQNIVFKWLQKQYRFPLLNYVEQNQLQILRKYFFNKSRAPELEQIQEMVDFSLSASKEEETQKQKITYPVTKEQSILLVKQFLEEIDPTCKWLSEFYTLEKSNRIIENIKDKRLQTRNRKNKIWSLFYSQEKKWCIYAPWRYTLEDSISLLHEFCHYISCKDETASDDTVFQLSEFPSLFFEEQMCEFLKRQGYPEEEVNKYLNNRRLEIIEYGLDIESYLRDLRVIMQGQEITLNLKKSNLKILEDEYRKSDPTFSLDKECGKSLEEWIIEDIDDDISSLLLMPDLIIETYPYIIGKKYSDIMASQLQNSSETLQKMINITERICKMKKEEVEEELGFREKSNKNIKIKRA